MKGEITMKKILKVVLVLFVAFLLIGVGGVSYLNRGLEAGMSIALEEVDLSSLDDGIYTGQYNAGRFSNEVKVEVKDKKIASISLVDDVLFSKPEVTRELIDKIVETQRIDVDVITGSTVTCNAYLKAIEDALVK